MADDNRVRQLRDQLAEERNHLKDGFFQPDDAEKNPIGTKMELRRKLTGHFQKVYAIDWAGNGSDLLVSASQDGKLIVWNAESTNKLNAIPLRSCWVMTCAFEKHTNQLVASGGLDNVCSVYRLGEHEVGAAIKPEKELEGHQGYISCCRFMDENKMITASGDKHCMFWDVTQGVCVNYFGEHGQDVMSVAPHPQDKNIFVSGSCDLECKLWDIRTKPSAMSFKGSPSGKFSGYRDEDELDGEEKPSLMSYPGHESDVNGVAFFPDGFAFGSGSDDATCRLFDLRCHQQVNQFKHATILCGITSVAFSKSGRILFGGYDDHNLLGWDVLQNPSPDTSESEQVVSLKKHDGRVSTVAVHSDGKALASGSWDTMIKVYA